MDSYPLVGRERIVVVLDYHVFQLADYAVRRLGVFGMYVDSYHYRRGEILAHHVDGKIIVNASVVKFHPIDADRKKYCRKRHRCPYCVAEHSAATNHFMLVGHIRCHAAERNEQPVEVAATLRRVGGEKIHEGEIHRKRRNQARRHDAGGGRGVATADIHVKMGERRSLPLLKEIICEVRIDSAGRPHPESLRLQKLHHFCRRIAAGV